MTKQTDVLNFQAELILKLMQDNNMSLRTLNMLSGLSYSKLQRITSGVREASLKDLLLMERIFNYALVHEISACIQGERNLDVIEEEKRKKRGLYENFSKEQADIIWADYLKTHRRIDVDIDN